MNKGGLQGKFIPWHYAIAANIRQVSLQEMAVDAQLMASAVIDSAKLFNPPALCMNFDPTLWAEAAGCATDWGSLSPCTMPGGSADPNPDLVRECPRVTTLIDAIQRVKGTLPQQPLACAMAGPATIAYSLEIGQPASTMDQFTVGELITEYVNVLCEHRIDNLVVIESANIEDHELAPWVASKQYSRIAKLANHYSVDTTLLCPQASLNEEQIREFDAFTFVVANAEQTIQAKLTHAIKGITVDGFGSGHVTLPSGLDALQKGQYFLTARWDLDPESDFANVQQDIATVTSFLEKQ
ncbi:MAG: uroporphyrinogen decarboxylase family protein [Pseudomonadales bacterium]